MMSSSDSTDDWTRLQELIEKAKFTMMATLTDDGSIRSRPMATQHINHDERGILWFFTGKDSHKVDELNANPHVNLGYSPRTPSLPPLPPLSVPPHPASTPPVCPVLRYIGDGQSLFISVTGTAELVLDHAKMKELWTEVLKAWFPQGLDDPNIALLKVTVRSAELWNSASPKLVQLYGFAKAKLTGEPHRDEGQEHRKITL